MANHAFLELCNKVYNQSATKEELGEFKSAMQVIASKGASPQAIWELNELLLKQANLILGPKLDFLNYIAETVTVGHGQKIEWRRPRGQAKMRWSARGTTVDYSRLGFQDRFVSNPVKIQGGAFYEYDQLLTGESDGFVGVVDALVSNMQDNITSKAFQVLHTAMASAPTVNRWSGAGITLANFDTISSTVQRYNRKATCVCDIDFAKKLSNLVPDSRMSFKMQDTLFENGYFGQIHGVDIVVFNNPYWDESNASLKAPREYAYILPAGTDKPVKIGFEGSMYQLTDTDMESERIFLKLGQKVAVDCFDTYYIGELDDTSLV